jgi:hypothetical protein
MYLQSHYTWLIRLLPRRIREASMEITGQSCARLRASRIPYNHATKYPLSSGSARWYVQSHVPRLPLRAMPRKRRKDSVTRSRDATTSWRAKADRMLTFHPAVCGRMVRTQYSAAIASSVVCWHVSEQISLDDF